MENIIPDKVFYLPIETGIVSVTNAKLASPVRCSELVELILEPTLSQSNAVGFCHISQVDCIRVLQGSLVIVIFFRKKFFYFPLSFEDNAYVVIQPKTWHGLLNPHNSNCRFYNATTRVGEIHKKDYSPISLEYRYNLELAKQSIETKSLLY